MTSQAGLALTCLLFLGGAGCCLETQSTASSTSGSATGGPSTAGATGTASGGTSGSNGGTTTGTETRTTTGTTTGNNDIPSCVIDGQRYPARTFEPGGPLNCCNPHVDPAGWTPLFVQSTIFPVASSSISGPNDGALGDLNGDGVMDVALTAYAGSDLQAQAWMYFSLPEGQSIGPNVAVSSQPGEVWPGGVAIADIDGDHRNDLIVSTMSSIDVFLNVGGNHFGPEIVTRTPPECGGAYLRPADVNSDGWMDVVAITESCGVKVFLNDTLGDGVLLAPSISIPARYQADGVIGDFNGDGLPDLAFAGPDGGVVWLPNMGGRLADAAQPNLGNDPAASNVYGMAAVALDAGSALLVASDGLLDIYFPTPEGPTLRDGYGSGVSVADIAAADLNGDGLTDLVLANGWGSGTMIDVWLSMPSERGWGDFSTYLVDLGGSPLQEIALGDIDGDGAPDLVVFRGDWESWINQCGPRAAEPFTDGGR